MRTLALSALMLSMVVLMSTGAAYAMYANDMLTNIRVNDAQETTVSYKTAPVEMNPAIQKSRWTRIVRALNPMRYFKSEDTAAMPQEEAPTPAVEK